MSFLRGYQGGKGISETKLVERCRDGFGSLGWMEVTEVRDDVLFCAFSSRYLEITENHSL